MIDYSTAIEIISAAAVPLAPEETTLDASCGAAAATDIASSVNVPAFANSAMDGYAVRARDTFGASDGLPAYLKVSGEVAMGQVPQDPSLETPSRPDRQRRLQKGG